MFIDSSVLYKAAAAYICLTTDYQFKVEFMDREMCALLCSNHNQCGGFTFNIMTGETEGGYKSEMGGGILYIEYLNKKKMSFYIKHVIKSTASIALRFSSKG